MRESWTQPVCENRFVELFGERSVIHRLNLPKDQWDPCCYCGEPTNIYVRLDPSTVPFPRVEDD